MTLLTAVGFLQKLRNRRKQPELDFILGREIALVAISFFVTSVCRLTLTRVYMLTSPLQACAPVAQRIEHLPCWSLSGEWFRRTR